MSDNLAPRRVISPYFVYCLQKKLQKNIADISVAAVNISGKKNLYFIRKTFLCVVADQSSVVASKYV